MIRDMLLMLCSLLFLLVFIAYGIVVLCYPDLAQKFAGSYRPKWVPKWWPYESDHHAWSSRLGGLAFIFFGVAAIVWMLSKMFAK